MTYGVIEFWKDDAGKIDWGKTNKFGCTYFVDEATHENAKRRALSQAVPGAHVIVKAQHTWPLIFGVEG